MDNNFKTTRRLLILLAAILLFTVVLLVMLGPDGLINQEVKDYNDTHVEENTEKANEKVVVVDNK